MEFPHQQSSPSSITPAPTPATPAPAEQMADALPTSVVESTPTTTLLAEGELATTATTPASLLPGEAVSEVTTVAVEGEGAQAEEKHEGHFHELSSVRRLIAPLSKEQLIELLATAALRFSEVHDAAVAMVNASPASRRLMIRNIAFSTKDADFVKLFQSFGDIDDATIVREKDSRSRGYGFVTYQSADAVQKVLKASLILDGRQLLAKLAGDPFADFSAGGTPGTNSIGNQTGARRKLFIRNLADSTDSATLRGLFGQYGSLEECVVVSDSEGRSRGYGFVTFTSPESAIRAVQEPQRIINGRVAFVAFATPTRAKNIPSGPGVVGLGMSPGTSRRNTRDSNAVHAARMSSLHSMASGGLPSPFGHTPGYPVHVASAYYGHHPAGSPPSFGSQTVGLPVGGYNDYAQMSLAAAVAANRRFG